MRSSPCAELLSSLLVLFLPLMDKAGVPEDEGSMEAEETSPGTEEGAEKEGGGVMAVRLLEVFSWRGRAACHDESMRR